jgi:Leucine-rich repeat (LRR) protein
MCLFTRTYTSLPQRTKWPTLCLRLNLMWANRNLQDWGTELLRFTRLRKLHIQGDSSIYDSLDFKLPPEIGNLQTLQHLTLLNLPVDFPDWIVNLQNLRYLMVRGTNLTTIPNWINRLSNLRTLKVENCSLSTLPIELREMDNLRELGLCDTQLFNFNPEQFPQKLKYLSFAGSGYYRRSDLESLQRALVSTDVSPHWPIGYDRDIMLPLTPGL